VQSALSKVPGVTKATVSYEKGEAVVSYIEERVKVEDLIKAVREARGMSSCDAKLKK
jgi:copper chaperone CopZ